jgi:hypothetical protein
MIDRIRLHDLFHELVTQSHCRLADRQVVAMIANSTGETPDEGFIEVMAEYTWDHWMGEPDEVSVEELVAFANTLQSVVECGCGLGWGHFYGE